MIWRQVFDLGLCSSKSVRKSSVIDKVYDGFSMSLNLQKGLYIKYAAASSFVIITYPRSTIIFPSHSALGKFNLLKPTGHVIHQQFNIQQLYVLPTLYLFVLYLSENKQGLVPLTA